MFCGKQYLAGPDGRSLARAQLLDFGVFRPSTGYWYLDYNFDGIVDKTIKFGKMGDIPVVGDFNADGKTDIGVFRP